MLKTMLLAAAAALTLAGTAAAQDARPAGRADADGDPRISLAEMQAAHAARFARLDANGDGALSRDERKAGRQAVRGQRTEQRADRMAARITRRDTNRDGGLNQAEAPKVWTRIAAFDVNRDARVTVEELRAGRQAMAAQRRADRSARAQVQGQARVRADANGDGLLTRAEANAQLRARFTRLDVNRDGFVTREERRAGRQARRGQA
jgi:Ca2+-binding EF-hand superfamily protein